VSRWAETEELAESWFRAHGWPYATRRGRAGHIDIENMPGLVPEVKSGSVWETRWLKQVTGNGPIGFILWRPPKFGPASVGHWPMVFRAEDGTRLLREAGYGDQPARNGDN
jgi:hypothetical protein